MREKLAAALLLLLASLDARAFHAGGVGECDGCHAIHGSPEGLLGATRGPFLLEAADSSSTCLNCHAGAARASHSVLTFGAPPGTPPVNYTPGGDFDWLTRSYLWTGAQGIEVSPGERHGHNVVAMDFGLAPDATLFTAPGGSYPADRLSCVSCHDPHGRYRILDAGGTTATTGKPIRASGSYGDSGEFTAPSATEAVGAYRLLAGAGYAPRSTPSALPFASNPPIAVAPSAYNQPETTADVRVAYGTGMSEWCRNCHGAMHGDGALNTTSTFGHPASVLVKLGSLASTYNTYVRTGDVSGDQTRSYTSLVPYEEGSSDRGVLSVHARSDGLDRSGPITGAENVMCLSCHRAHASGWDHGLRWNQHAANEQIVVGGQWPGVDATGDAAAPAAAQGRTQADTRAAMYDRDPASYAAFQRVLCDKCHGDR